MATIKVDIELDPTQAQAAARKIGDALQSAIDIKRTPGAILESLSIDEFNRILGIVRQIEATQEKIKAATGATDAEVRSVVSYRQKELDLTIKTLTEQKKILDATRAQTAEKQKQSTIPTMSGRSAFFNQAQFQQRASSITALRPVLDLRQDPSWEFTRKASQIALDLAKQRQSILKSNSRAYFEEYSITLNTLNALRQGVQFRVRERTELEKTLATQRGITSQIDQQRTKSGQVSGRGPSRTATPLKEEGAFDSLISSARSLRGTLSLITGLLALTGIDKFVDTAREGSLQLDQMRQRFIGLTGSVERANDKMEQLREIVRTSPGVTTKLALDLSSQFQAIGGVTEKTINDVIRAVGKLNSVFTIQDTSTFARNLTQIFSTGFSRVDIKEALRQVPIFEQLIEEAFGTSDPDKLREMKASGRLTMETWLSGLAAAADRGLGDVNQSLTTQIEKLTESLGVNLSPIGDQINRAIIAALRSINSFLEQNRQGVETFATRVADRIKLLWDTISLFNQVNPLHGFLKAIIPLGKAALSGLDLLFDGIRNGVDYLNKVEIKTELIGFYEQVYSLVRRIALTQAGLAPPGQNPRLTTRERRVVAFVGEAVTRPGEVGAAALETLFGMETAPPPGAPRPNIRAPREVGESAQKAAQSELRAAFLENQKLGKKAADERAKLQDTLKRLQEAEFALEQDRIKSLRENLQDELDIRRQQLDISRQFNVRGLEILNERSESIRARLAVEEDYYQKLYNIGEAGSQSIAAQELAFQVERKQQLESSLNSLQEARKRTRSLLEQAEIDVKITDIRSKILEADADIKDISDRIAKATSALIKLRAELVVPLTGRTDFIGPDSFRGNLDIPPPPSRDPNDILAEKSAEIRRQILQIDREINRGAVNEADTRKQINDLLRQEAEFKIQIKMAELERTDSPSRRAAILEQIEELKNVGIELTNTERFMRGFRSSIESTGDAFDRLGQNISRSLQNVQGLLGNLKKSFLQFFNDILGAGLQRFFAEILGPILGVTGQRRGASAGGGVTGAVGAATGALFGGGGGSGGGILGALFGGGGSGGGSGVGGFRTPPFVPGGVAVGAGVGGLGAILGGLGVAGGALTIAEALKRGQGPQLNGIPGIFDSGMPALGGGVLKTGGPISVLKEIFKGNAFKGFGRNLPVGSARGPLASIAPLLGAQLGIGLGGRSKLGQVLGGIGGAALGIGITAAPAILGVGGAVAGILGAKLTAALAGLFSNPVTAVIGGALLVGSLLLGRSQQRRSDEEQSGIYLQDAVSQMMALKERVKAGGASVEETRKAGEQIIQTFISQINTIKTKSVRESRLTNQVRDLRNILESQVIPAVASGQKRSSTESRLIPEFNMGGMVPGIDKGYDSILARVRPGEMILNRDQQKSIRQSLGYNVFAMAGVPNVAAGGFAAPGGNLMRGTDDGPLMIELNVGLGISDRDATRIVAAAGTTSNGRRVIVSSVRRGQKK